jgi:hypothetical protein
VVGLPAAMNLLSVILELGLLQESLPILRDGGVRYVRW